MAQELQATLAWFDNPASQTSANVVVDQDGTIYECVPDYLESWGDRELNAAYLNMELVRRGAQDPVTDAQYASLKWWLGQMSAKYGFARNAQTLLEHRLTAPGIREGKIDIGPDFSLARVL